MWTSVLDSMIQSALCSKYVINGPKILLCLKDLSVSPGPLLSPLSPGLLCSIFTYYAFEQCSNNLPIMLNIMPMTTAIMPPQIINALASLYKPLLMHRTGGILLAYLDCYVQILFVVLLTLVDQLAPGRDLLVCLQLAVDCCWLIVFLLLI